MATMGFQWSGIGAAPNVVEAKEADSQSFVVNDLVYLNAGAVTIATDAAISGVALKAATNVTTGNATIPVQIITPDSVWIAQADAATSVDYVGEDYGLNYTAGSMSVDIGDTSTTQVRIEKIDSRDGAGVSPYRVHVRFKLDGTLDDLG